MISIYGLGSDYMYQEGDKEGNCQQGMSQTLTERCLKYVMHGKAKI